jgi:hypothetical protein
MDTPTTTTSRLSCEAPLQRSEAGKLVDAHGLLEALFDEQSRPSLRWVRQMQAQRKIPYVKIGHLVRFDLDKVRAALDETCTIYPRRR